METATSRESYLEGRLHLTTRFEANKSKIKKLVSQEKEEQNKWILVEITGKGSPANFAMHKPLSCVGCFNGAHVATNQQQGKIAFSLA